MDSLRLLLIAGSVALVFILVRALFSGNIHSQYAVTHRDENPGTFWALWFVLLLPLFPILMLVMRVKAH
ncbi:MAG TPA: hypothetical protein VGG68_11210 [Caulobacteraceae bacterium]|jgi:hypothetical protein